MDPQQNSDERQKTAATLQFHSAVDDDNIAARRAAQEACEIGRATLVVLDAQGEQLERTEEMAESASFAVKKSNRILRGMGSWGGWVANLATPNVTRITATKEYKKCGEGAPRTEAAPMMEGGVDEEHRSHLLGGRTTRTGGPTKPGSLDSIYERQENHLDAMSAAAAELSGIGMAMSSALSEQVEAIARIESNTETLNDDIRTVSRRAGRIAQSKWSKREKAAFKMYVNIRQIETQLLLGSMNDVVVLSASSPLALANIWGLWERQGNAIGLRNELTGRWIGQGFLGDIRCTAMEFGKWEEWEINEKCMSSTRLICCSANWNSGGYIHADQDTLTVKGINPDSKKGAAFWSFTESEGYEQRKMAKTNKK